jgi:tetratricopeptide (TPR) repeat protein
VTEAFSLQDQITLRILRGLEIDLSTAERNRIQYLDDTNDLNAWLHAANGVRQLIKLDPSNLEHAFTSYRKALEIDPDYISARRGLAWHALLKVRFGKSTDPAKDLQEARNHLNVILRRKPDDGMSRGLESLMLLLEDDWDTAVDSGHRATKLLPGSADVWAVLAHTYTFTGDQEKALEAINRAMSLSPGHPEFYDWIKARTLRLLGQNEAAIELLNRGIDRDDRTLVQLVELTIALSAAGRVEEARQLADRIQRKSPEFSASRWVLHPSAKNADQQSIEFELLSRAGL